MLRTVEQWDKILKGLFPQDAAKRILGDLTDYRLNGNHKDDDVKQLANALTAYQSINDE